MRVVVRTAWALRSIAKALARKADELDPPKVDPAMVGRTLHTAIDEDAIRAVIRSAVEAAAAGGPARTRECLTFESPSAATRWSCQCGACIAWRARELRVAQ